MKITSYGDTALITPAVAVIVVPSTSTTPNTDELAVATVIFGVAPPLDEIAPEPVTAVTVPPPPDVCGF